MNVVGCGSELVQLQEHTKKKSGLRKNCLLSRKLSFGIFTSFSCLAIALAVPSSLFCNSSGTVLSNSRSNIESTVSVNHFEIDWSRALRTIFRNNINAE